MFPVHILYPRWYTCRNLLCEDRKGQRGWPQGIGDVSWERVCMNVAGWSSPSQQLNWHVFVPHVENLTSWSYWQGIKLCLMDLMNMRFMSPYSCPRRFYCCINVSIGKTDAWHQAWSMIWLNYVKPPCCLYYFFLQGWGELFLNRLIQIMASLSHLTIVNR